MKNNLHNFLDHLYDKSLYLYAFFNTNWVYEIPLIITNDADNHE